MWTTFDVNLPFSITVLSSHDYSWDLVADRWNEIRPQTGFDYEGTSDVVIDIVVTGNSMPNGSARFHRQSGKTHVFAYGWTGSPPMTGIMDQQALKLRVVAALGTTAGPSGMASLTFGVSFDPKLIGTILYFHWVHLNRLAPGGAAFSKYARIAYGR